MRRIIAIGAVLAALALGACGGDDESTAPAPTNAETATAPTDVPTVGTGNTTADQIPTAPESATDPSTGAPDEGISDRPGGPSDAGGGGY